MRLNNTYNSPNPFIRKYFKKRVEKAIEFAELKKDDKIIDYGAGPGYLEQRLPDYNIIPFEKEHILDNLDMFDFNKIFCLDVLEHMSFDEIIKLLTIVKLKKAILITSIPKGNLLSKIIRLICLRKPTPSDHITSYKKLQKILSYYFKKDREYNLLNMNVIQRWS